MERKWKAPDGLADYQPNDDTSYMITDRHLLDELKKFRQESGIQPQEFCIKAIIFGLIVYRFEKKTPDTQVLEANNNSEIIGKISLESSKYPQPAVTPITFLEKLGLVKLKPILGYKFFSVREVLSDELMEATNCYQVTVEEMLRRMLLLSIRIARSQKQGNKVLFYSPKEGHIPFYPF